MAACTETPPSAPVIGQRLEKGHNKVYRCGDLVVAPNPPEKTLGHAYMRFDVDGLLPVIHYEAGPDGPGLLWFLENYTKVTTLAGMVHTKGREEVSGLGWVSAMGLYANGEYRKAEVGVGYFRATPPSHTFLLTQMMLEWIFTELDLDLVLALSPAPNRAAIRFIRRLGFELFGPIPDSVGWMGKPAASYQAALTRKRWHEMEVFK